MSINVPEYCVILSPSGATLNPNLIQSGTNGVNVAPGVLTYPVPGMILSTAGRGDFSIFHAGIRGTLTSEFTVSTSGSARTIFEVSSVNPAGSACLVSLQLDTSNRPLVVILDSLGTTAASWSPSGAAIASGTTLKVKVVWDSVEGTVTFTYLDGTAIAGSWGTYPTAPWAMVPFEYAFVGHHTGFGDFNGTILRNQVGDQT